MKAITIIRDEHRAITAVIEGLRHLLAEVVEGRMTPDHTLFGAMFHYIETIAPPPWGVGLESKPPR